MKYMINIHATLLLARDHYLEKSHQHPMFYFLTGLITKPWAKLIQHADVSLGQLLLYDKPIGEFDGNVKKVVVDYNPEGPKYDTAGFGYIMPNGAEYVMWKSSNKIQEIARGSRETVLLQLHEWLLEKQGEGAAAK